MRSVRHWLGCVALGLSAGVFGCELTPFCDVPGHECVIDETSTIGLVDELCGAGQQ